MASKPAAKTLDELIKIARNAPPMTAIERMLQRRRWARAEFALSHPEMTEAEVDAAMDRALGKLEPPL